VQQLLADIRAGRIDLVVIYKVGRLTRSLADFAKLVEIFDAQGVSFVSITQHFNTTTSIGRLSDLLVCTWVGSTQRRQLSQPSEGQTRRGLTMDTRSTKDNTPTQALYSKWLQTEVLHTLQRPLSDHPGESERGIAGALFLHPLQPRVAGFVSWLALLHRARERHVACNAAYRNAAVPTVWVEWDVTVEQDAADGAVLGPIRTRRSMPCHAMGSRGRNRAAPD
jgi:hypothetical protein